MPHHDRLPSARRAGAAALLWAAAAGSAGAADLPFMSSASPPPFDGAPRHGGGGGYAVAVVPLRPAPLRYDIYGYPLLQRIPSPLAGGGCPPALQPGYDPDGNLAGYAPIPMCR